MRTFRTRGTALKAAASPPRVWPPRDMIAV
jgi:hypothetical protein